MSSAGSAGRGGDRGPHGGGAGGAGAVGAAPPPPPRPPSATARRQMARIPVPKVQARDLAPPQGGAASANSEGSTGSAGSSGGDAGSARLQQAQMRRFSLGSVVSQLHKIQHTSTSTQLALAAMFGKATRFQSAARRIVRLNRVVDMLRSKNRKQIEKAVQELQPIVNAPENAGILHDVGVEAPLVSLLSLDPLTHWLIVGNALHSLYTLALHPQCALALVHHPSFDTVLSEFLRSERQLVRRLTAGIICRMFKQHLQHEQDVLAHPVLRQLLLSLLMLNSPDIHEQALLVLDNLCHHFDHVLVLMHKNRSTRIPEDALQQQQQQQHNPSDDAVGGFASPGAFGSPGAASSNASGSASGSVDRSTPAADGGPPSTPNADTLTELSPYSRRPATASAVMSSASGGSMAASPGSTPGRPAKKGLGFRRRARTMRKQGRSESVASSTDRANDEQSFTEDGGGAEPSMYGEVVVRRSDSSGDGSGAQRTGSSLLAVQQQQQQPNVLDLVLDLMTRQTHPLRTQILILQVLLGIVTNAQLSPQLLLSIRSVAQRLEKEMLHLLLAEDIAVAHDMVRSTADELREAEAGTSAAVSNSPMPSVRRSSVTSGPVRIIIGPPPSGLLYNQNPLSVTLAERHIVKELAVEILWYVRSCFSAIRPDSVQPDTRKAAFVVKARRQEEEGGW